MFAQMMKVRNNKLLSILLVGIFFFSFLMPVQAAGEGGGAGDGSGANPLVFKHACLTTTNRLTETDPLKQVSTPGKSLKNNKSVPDGLQTVDIWIDKNIITDNNGCFENNKNCITLKDLTIGSDVTLDFFRLGATDGTGVYRQHIYFDVTFEAGHEYKLIIDENITANNGLSLGTTITVNFAVAGGAGAGAGGGGGSSGSGGMSAEALEEWERSFIKVDFACAELDAEGKVISVIFSKPLTSFIADPACFKVLADGIEYEIKEAVLSNDRLEVELTLGMSLLGVQAVTLNYTVPSGTIVDTNDILGSFRDKPVTVGNSLEISGPTTPTEPDRPTLAGLTEKSKDAAIKALNAGSKSWGNFAEAGVTGAVEGKREAYVIAIEQAKLRKGADLVLEEIQREVDSVNKGVSAKALKTINAGTSVLADYVTAGVKDAAVRNLAGYTKAIAEARAKKRSNLTLPEIQSEVNAVNLKVAERALKYINDGEAVFADYAAAGVKGAVAENKGEYDRAIKEARRTEGTSSSMAVLTLARVQTHVNRVNESAPALALKAINEGQAVFADYVKAGVTGAEGRNKVAYDKAIAKAKESAGGALTLRQVQLAVDKVDTKAAALKAINEGTEAFADFVKAGVSGAVAEYKDDYDLRIAEAKTEKGVDLTLAEVQELVNKSNKTVMRQPLK